MDADVRTRSEELVDAILRDVGVTLLDLRTRPHMVELCMSELMRGSHSTPVDRAAAAAELVARMFDHAV